MFKLLHNRSSRRVLLCATVAAGIAAPVLVITSASAVTGLVVVTATSTEHGSEGFKGANAVCPAGTNILGGGADISGGGHSVQLAGLNPVPLGLPANSMWATANEDRLGYEGSWSITAWAICASGVSGHQIVQASSAEPADSTIASASATCPSGKKVIGAGGASAGKPSYVLDGVDISADLTSVHVETIATESPTPGTAPLAQAFAICVNPVAGLQLVRASSGFTSSDQSLSVSCPSGKRLHGTGGGMTGAVGQAHLDMLAPTGSRTARIDAREDATGTGNTWKVDIFAICAS
jgi:hypothetical protein